MIRTHIFILILLLWLFFMSACFRSHSNEPLFYFVDSTQTNIGFINKVEHKNGDLTVVDYLYYYNGAGVAAGDINNDGLMDLFFVSNHQANRLYLNQGDLQFKDISQAAGITGFSHWKTGVTMVDINGDGWLDIYICALSNYKTLEGSNELYINNGDNTFSEKSAEYGLDFSGMATQSAFFDYDHDGDLDIYLLTHAPHNARSYDRVMAIGLTDQTASDHFFRNDDGIFSDVSAAVGIDSSSIGYGLGITIADINHDGWEDIYVANDFYESDKFYINMGDGTFREKAADIFDFGSRYARGCDIADVNNDGYEDVMTVDIRPVKTIAQKSSQLDDDWETFHYKKAYQYPLQFSRNVLQQNHGDMSFSEVAAYAGVSGSDWSWSVLMADFNNDGLKDIITTQGIPKALNDLDFLEYAHKDSMRYAIDLSSAHIRRALEIMPDGKASNHLFENQGGFQFLDKSKEWGLGRMGYSNGAVYADLDNDGDLDIITNNLNEPAGVFENRSATLRTENHFISIQLKGQGKNTGGLGAKVYIKTRDGFQMQHVMPTRGFLSSISVPLFFGLGNNDLIDSLVVIWPGTNRHQVLTHVKANQHLVVAESNASSSSLPLSLFPKGDGILTKSVILSDTGFIHHENEYYDFYREPLIPFLVSREGPSLAVGDVNSDGLDDFYVGGAKHQTAKLYIQQDNGRFLSSYQNAFEKDKILENVDALIIDVDGDQDLDLYSVSGGNEFYGTMEQQSDRLYRNDGKGNFSRDTTALPSMLQNKSCVRSADIDNDGDIDFFVGGRVVPFRYGVPASSFILINDGYGKFKDRTKSYNPDFKTLGMITDAQWADLDKDGDMDLVVVGDWMAVRIFLNQEGKLVELHDFIAPNGIKNINGFWQGLSIDDFDHDGDMDFVVGNLGYNSTLRINTEKSSLRLYTQDLNDNLNGQTILAGADENGQYYPLVPRDELIREGPPSSEKVFIRNIDYAKLDMNTLASHLKIKLDPSLEVNQFASLYFENINEKKFYVRLLPKEVQTSKVYTIAKDDVNRDGHMDLVVGGNALNVSPVQGSYMASRGTVLLGDGRGEFKALSQAESGLNIRGEIRKIVKVRIKNKSGFMFALNADSLTFFQTK